MRLRDRKVGYKQALVVANDFPVDDGLHVPFLHILLYHFGKMRNPKVSREIALEIGCCDISVELTKRNASRIVDCGR